jgi:dolichyl-phosphate-mannose-protein mannosyltransferase
MYNFVKIIFFAFTIFFAASSLLLAAGNLIINPGIEDSDSVISNWRVLTFERGVSIFRIDTTQAHTGGKCATISNNVLDDARLVQTVNVTGGASYLIGGWIKAENIGADGAGANISIENHWVKSNEIRGTSRDWEKVEFLINVASDITSLEIGLRLGGTSAMSTGKASFDDIYMEKIENYSGDSPKYSVSSDSMVIRMDNKSATGCMLDRSMPPPILPYMENILLIVFLVLTVVVYCVLLFVKPGKSGKKS